MASPRDMEAVTSPYRRRSRVRGDHDDFPQTRRRSPSSERDRDRKRYRGDRYSPDLMRRNSDRSFDRDRRQFDSRRPSASFLSRKPSGYGAHSKGDGLNGASAYGRRKSGVSRPYEPLQEAASGAGMDAIAPQSNGLQPPASTSPYNGGGLTPRRDGGPSGLGHGLRNGPFVPASISNHPPTHAKSRRLYIGNVPFQAGLTDYALVQFFSAIYVAAFRPNVPGEPLPVVSFWLHGDGKFGFMELRGEQETINMMQFNQIMLHGRPLKVNRPSDYRPEIHNPNGGHIQPEEIDVDAVLSLCEKLEGLASPPPLMVARAQAIRAARQKDESEYANEPMATNDLEKNDIGPSKNPANRIDPPADINDSADVNRADEITTKGDTSSKDEAANTETTSTRPSVSDLGRQNAVVHNSKSDKVVISLQNLVTDDDLDGDDEDYQAIVEDVEGECGNYGEVVSVNIPRAGHWKRTAFVQFADEAGASRAIESLAKRVFDGRKIVAVFVEGCSTAEEAANRSG